MQVSPEQTKFHTTQPEFPEAGPFACPKAGWPLVSSGSRARTYSSAGHPIGVDPPRIIALYRAGTYHNRFDRSGKRNTEACGQLVICPVFIARDVSGHLGSLDGEIGMERARIHEGIRRMRFSDVLDRTERSELSQMEAAVVLGGARKHFDYGMIGAATKMLGGPG